MTLESKISGLLALGVLFALILYVAFGQITVRKLRKNPETKARLGMEFASGWDIVNVAQALSFPRSLSRKLERGPLSSLYANSEILFDHTTKLDRWLARTFYWLFLASGVPLIILALIHAFGSGD